MGSSSAPATATSAASPSISRPPDGLTELHTLLDGADVLITNWRPGVAEAFGLEAESVRDRWPRLVWVRVSGYGQTGPMATLPAFDSLMQARVGFADSLGDEPALVPSYVADKVTATFVAQSALGGARPAQRDRARGCVVDVAMLDAFAYFDTPDLFAGHQQPGRTDDRVLRMLRAPRAMQTADGWLVLAPTTGQQIKRAMTAAGLEEQARRAAIAARRDRRIGALLRAARTAASASARPPIGRRSLPRPTCRRAR